MFCLIYTRWQLVAFASVLYLALLFGSTYADTLPLTKLRAAESQRAGNAINAILRHVWAAEIMGVGGRTYSFTYGLFKAGKDQYLVSSFRSAESCRPDECAWTVQRLTPFHEIAASGHPFTACGAINQVDVMEGKLTICGQDVDLP